VHILLARVYVFAENMLDRQSKLSVESAIVDTVGEVRGVSHYPEPEAIRCVFDGTPAGDPLRELHIGFYVHKVQGGAVKDTRPSYYHQDFLHGVMVDMIGRRRSAGGKGRVEDGDEHGRASYDGCRPSRCGVDRDSID
jgi:hypothetical protein